jgi:phosphoglycerate dehydrogenase-like enzyme
MSAGPPARIAVLPGTAPAWQVEAVQEGGGQVVPLAEAEALVWADPSGAGATALEGVLEQAPQLRWIQLPFAGVEPMIHLVDDDRVWTCGKGVYAEPVAEMALALGLAGLREVGRYAKATGWGPQRGVSLVGGRVTIIGGGGITEELLKLLAPFKAHVTVVRNRPDAMDGADDVFESEYLDRALPGADLVVLALALTPDTVGIMGADQFALMEPHACLVNVARGKHVITDDLVEALREGQIGSAGLDVTDPEPLPDDHPLWSLPTCTITPHTGNTPEMAKPLLRARIVENVRRYVEDRPLIGRIDPSLGY